MGWKAGNIPLLGADLCPNPPIPAFLCFPLFALPFFCPIAPASFSLSHLKKVSTFDLSCFCSYYSCFLLLFMKFLNTAGISSLLWETPSSPVFCLLLPHSSLSWISNPDCNFQPLHPIRHLWHIVWAPFPRMALLLHLSVSAAQPSLLSVGLAAICPWPTCVAALHRAVCETVQQHPHLQLCGQVWHVHVLSR